MNIVYEVDELHHFDCYGNLRKKDKSRQKEIENEFLTAYEMKSLPDFVFGLDIKIIDKDQAQFSKMSKKELILIRNSIFAQYGMEFKTPWIDNYFRSRKWYKPGGFKDSMLTPIDRKNIEIIKGIEEKR